MVLPCHKRGHQGALGRENQGVCLVMITVALAAAGLGVILPARKFNNWPYPYKLAAPDPCPTSPHASHASVWGHYPLWPLLVGAGTHSTSYIKGSHYPLTTCFPDLRQERLELLDQSFYDCDYRSAVSPGLGQPESSCNTK